MTEIIEPVLHNKEPYWLTRRYVEGKSLVNAEVSG